MSNSDLDPASLTIINNTLVDGRPAYTAVFPIDYVSVDREGFRCTPWGTIDSEGSEELVIKIVGREYGGGTFYGLDIESGSVIGADSARSGEGRDSLFNRQLANISCFQSQLCTLSSD